MAIVLWFATLSACWVLIVTKCQDRLRIPAQPDSPLCLHDRHVCEHAGNADSAVEDCYPRRHCALDDRLPPCRILQPWNSHKEV